MSFAFMGPAQTRSELGPTGTLRDGSQIKNYSLEGHNSLLQSQNHNLRLLGTGDVGGPFFLEKSGSDWSLGHLSRTNYEGPCWSCSVWSSELSSYNTIASQPTLTALNARGTTAIARTEPTNPAFSMSTAVGELLSGGMPSVYGAALWREKTLNARAAGSEYLNHSFGWVPFVNDIKNFSHAVNASDRIMSTYKKNSGKQIRRSYQFPLAEQTAQKVAQYSIGSPFSTQLGVTNATQVGRKYERIWFSGAYRYNIPASSGQMSRVQEYGRYARVILGVELTPEVLWNLAPWSWAADWFGNVGDILHNVSAQGRDGLVTQYAYVMHEQAAERTMSGPFGGRRQYRIRKMRVPGTPYGFGVNLSSLTAKQTSILLALGLSRS